VQISGFQRKNLNLLFVEVYLFYGKEYSRRIYLVWVAPIRLQECIQEESILFRLVSKAFTGIGRNSLIAIYGHEGSLACATVDANQQCETT